MNIFQSLARIANNLDQRGLKKEADFVDTVLVKMAQSTYQILNKKKQALIEEIARDINSKAPVSYDTYKQVGIDSYRARPGKDNNLTTPDEPVLLIGFSYRSEYKDRKSREEKVKSLMNEHKSKVDAAGLVYTISYRQVDTSIIADFLTGIQDLVPPEDQPDLMSLFVVDFDRPGGDPGMFENTYEKVKGLFS